MKGSELEFRAFNTIVKRFQEFTLEDLGKPENHPIQWHILKFDRLTGLTDSNNKKVWENDFLDVFILHSDGREEKGIFKVIWDDYAFCIEDITGNACDAWLSLLNPNVCNQEAEFKVIGNSHLNPELGIKKLQSNDH